jgi:serine/threonine protein kinase
MAAEKIGEHPSLPRVNELLSSNEHVYRIVASWRTHRVLTGYEIIAGRTQARERGKPVFIKYAPADAEIRKLFDREQTILQRLAQAGITKNVLQPIDVFERHDISYLVLPDAQAIDLNRILRRYGPYTTSDIVAVARTIGNLLEQTCQARIYHADQKPENILARGRKEETTMKRRQLWLVDWSHSDHPDLPRLAKPGFCSGTLGFLAPEILQEARANAATEVYGLGATLYTLATAYPPHYTRNLREYYAAVLLGDQLRMDAEQRARIGPRVSEVIERSLARKPDDRPQSPGVLAQELVDAARKDQRTPLRLAVDAGIETISTFIKFPR